MNLHRHGKQRTREGAADYRTIGRTREERIEDHAIAGPQKKNAGAKPTSGKKPSGKDAPVERVVAHNRKAAHNYVILDRLECGIALVGSEVKTLRSGRLSLDEAFARVKDGEVWLLNCDIPEYAEASRFNHNPKRPRKLLLHRGEIRKFAAQAMQKGLTLVPLKLYFLGSRVKVLLGVCRGKQAHDKRQSLREADAKREMGRAMRRGR